ncbi:hypothetical protein [Terriglobus roseus]|nr:hypothetical protein [Terriglobus roseus]
MAMSPATGYRLREPASAVSPAAGLARMAAIAQDAGHYEINTLPRTRPDQGNLPCCVSCALAGGMEAIDASIASFSAMFHYHVSRYDNGAGDGAGFIGIDDGFNTLRAQGICSSILHPAPYTIAGTQMVPSAAAYTDAFNRAWIRSAHYDSPSGPSRAAWAREELKQDRPIVLGFELPAAYPSHFLDLNLEWLSPSSSPPGGTGHCVVAIGYDDVRRCLHIQDWRGDSAFDEGRWWMGYSVVDSSIVREMYSLFA